MLIATPHARGRLMSTLTNRRRLSSYRPETKEDGEPLKTSRLIEEKPQPFAAAK
jgi:hypothetical protein